MTSLPTAGPGAPSLALPAASRKALNPTCCAALGLRRSGDCDCPAGADGLLLVAAAGLRPPGRRARPLSLPPARTSRPASASSPTYAPPSARRSPGYGRTARSAHALDDTPWADQIDGKSDKARGSWLARRLRPHGIVDAIRAGEPPEEPTTIALTLTLSINPDRADRVNDELNEVRRIVAERSAGR